MCTYEVIWRSEKSDTGIESVCVNADDSESARVRVARLHQIELGDIESVMEV